MIEWSDHRTSTGALSSTKGQAFTARLISGRLQTSDLAVRLERMGRRAARAVEEEPVGLRAIEAGKALACAEENVEYPRRSTEGVLT